MSEIPPTYGQGAIPPIEPPPTPRLSDEAERILEHRGRLRARNISLRIARLNLRGEQEAVRRENEIVIDSLRSKVAEQYGPSIAERSIRDLRSAIPGQPGQIDRRAVDAGFQNARSIDAELRERPEVRPYLPGSERFGTLSRKFDLTSESAVRKYQRSLNDALAACRVPLTPAQVAAFAEVAASDSAEFRVRRADVSTTDYRDFSARITADPDEAILMGFFEATGIALTNTFANFTRVDLFEAWAKDPRPVGEVSGGDKIHISVTRADLPKAWAALQPLLLSEDNPFPSWKMTILKNVDRGSETLMDEIAELAGEPGFDAERERKEVLLSDIRVTEGMQFTLYPYSRFEDPDFVSDGPTFRHFLTLLEWTLADGKVRPGRIPESDTAIEGLSFMTFRNDNVSSRGAEVGQAPIIPEMIARLRDLPFYRAIHQQ